MATTSATAANTNASNLEKGNGAPLGGTTSNEQTLHNQRISHAVTPGGHPVDTTQPGFPVFHRRIANPAPLGLFSFASTTLVLSLFNVSTRGINTPNVIVGMAMACGGLAQLLAGMWEFAAGNTFGATAFTSYGAFWMSFGLIYWPSSGILTAYADVPGQLSSALGIYLITWFIFTFIMLLATFKSSGGLFSVFFFLTITFMLLSIGEFQASAGAHKAGGVFGIITAFCAYYTGAAGLYTSDSTYFTLPAYDLNRKNH